MTKFKEGIYIGIDLGTTYSCAAFVENDRSKTVSNEDGIFTY